jgi:hypothetical protein
MTMGTLLFPALAQEEKPTTVPSGVEKEAVGAADLFYCPKDPRTGTMWDTWLYFHEGTYYLYYLARAGSNWDNISLATSTDGVRWQERGPIVTKREKVTWMGTGSTWKSPNFEQDGKWFMNYSEWTGPRQTIFFAESTNLVDWTPLGDEFEFVQDERWYKPDGRWDCIWTLPRPEGGFYGYWTATPKARRAFGFGQSVDGVRWEALEPPETPGVPHGEVGAVERIGNRYYMLFGVYYQNMTMMTLVADRPEGPFSPVPKNRILLTGGDTYFARFFQSPDGLLVNHHSCAGVIYFGTLKTALVDAEGTLRLGWWRGNEAFKQGRPAMPLEATASESSAPLAFLKPSLDFKKGLILEGRLPIPQGEGEPPVGLFLEAPGSERGTAIRIGVSGVTQFGKCKSDGSEFEVAKTVNREWPFGPTARFRLLWQGFLLEFYLDDLLIEVYRLPLPTSGRIGVWSGAGRPNLETWRAWGMKSDE